MEKLKVTIEKLSDGTYLAYLNNWKHIFSFGNSVEDVKTGIKTKLDTYQTLSVQQAEVEYTVLFDRA